MSYHLREAKTTGTIL